MDSIGYKYKKQGKKAVKTAIQYPIKQHRIKVLRSYVAIYKHFIAVMACLSNKKRVCA